MDARHQRRAFTLIEAMVTMAIAGIISAAAAGTMAIVLRTTSATRAGVAVTNAAGQSVQFLSKDIENAGGKGLPPASSIAVEPDTCLARDGFPACAGNDRITLFAAVPEAPTCAVRVGSRPDTLSFQYVQGGCCFPSMMPSQQQQQPTPVEGILMLSAGPLFRPVHVVGVANAVCEFTATDAMPQSLYLNDLDPNAHAVIAVDDFTPFVNGRATAVRMRTYYVDAATHELRMRVGLNPTSTLVADLIFDLQISVGYDDDGSGRVDADEFAWRESALPAPGSFLPRLFAPREVLLSIVQGLEASLKPDTVTSPLRPPGAGKTISVPGFALHTAQIRLIPYNSILSVTP